MTNHPTLDHDNYADETLHLDFKREGLVLRREAATENRPRGMVKTNVPHYVEMGSPDGFEFGYGGSGPHDLALNACEHIVQHLAAEGHIDEPDAYYTAAEGDVRNGRVSKVAFLLAHEFKAEFIAPADTSGENYDYEHIKNWALAQIETADDL